jgi:hypothetical protein
MMKTTKRSPHPFAAAAIAATVAAAVASPAQAVTLGQTDTFSGSIQGWFAGGGPGGGIPPDPPSVVGGGGPGGAGDSYMLVTANGTFGPGGRLVAMNGSQWAGNYLAAGVSAISMDLRNFGTTDLTLRFLFEDPLGGAPTNIGVSSLGFSLAAGSDWTHVTVPVGVADLTMLTGDATTLLSNTTLIRLFHGTTTGFPPETIAAQLGVDNVRAVPEPAALTLMLAGLAGWVGLRRLRR